MGEPSKDTEKSLGEILSDVPTGPGRWRRVRWLLAGLLGAAAIVGAISQLLGVGDDIVKPARSAYHWGYGKLFPERAEADRVRLAKKAAADRVARTMAAEAEKLSMLEAGVTISSFREILKEKTPDYRFRAPGHLTRELYVRSYDYVQAWVDPNQDVVTFSVTIRKENFHPVLRFAGRPIVLGQDSIAKASGGAYTLGGGCPAHSGYYYEAFGGSGVEHNQYAAVGFASIAAGNNQPAWNLLCDGHEGAQRLEECNLEFHPGHPVYSASSDGPLCFTDSPIGKQFRKLAIVNVFAIAAPGRNLPEESYPDDPRLAPHDQEIN